MKLLLRPKEFPHARVFISMNHIAITLDVYVFMWTGFLICIEYITFVLFNLVKNTYGETNTTSNLHVYWITCFACKGLMIMIFSHMNERHINALGQIYIIVASFTSQTICISSYVFHFVFFFILFIVFNILNHFTLGVYVRAFVFVFWLRWNSYFPSKEHHAVRWITINVFCYFARFLYVLTIISRFIGLAHWSLITHIRSVHRVIFGAGFGVAVRCN